MGMYNAAQFVRYDPLANYGSTLYTLQNRALVAVGTSGVLLQRYQYHVGLGDAMQPTDAELVLACRRGDEYAWEQLIERYKSLIYAIPRRAGLDEDLAAEVFQRVFVRLLDRIESIEQPERISAWLVTTARRETWRISKRNRFLSTVLPLESYTDDEEGDIPDASQLPEDMLLRLEDQRIIRTAIDSLGERCRTLLTLLFYDPDSPSYAEIAVTLGIKAGSIGALRARCLQKLLTELELLGWE
jgi:RNA polymerase sigma factor (sigma-70 family)